MNMSICAAPSVTTAATTALSAALARTVEQVQVLELLCADRPASDPDLLADRLEETCVELSGDLTEARERLHHGGWSGLVAVDGLLRRCERRLSAAAGAAPRIALARMVARRGGEWPTWLGATVPALDDLATRLADAGDALHDALAAGHPPDPT
jgi:hypothetical protein